MPSIHQKPCKQSTCSSTTYRHNLTNSNKHLPCKHTNEPAWQDYTSVMVLTRLPLLAGPTDGECFSGRRRGRDTDESERLKTSLNRLRETHENGRKRLFYIRPVIPNHVRPMQRFLCSTMKLIENHRFTFLTALAHDSPHLDPSASAQTFFSSVALLNLSCLFQSNELCNSTLGHTGPQQAWLGSTALDSCVHEGCAADMVETYTCNMEGATKEMQHREQRPAWLEKYFKFVNNVVFSGSPFQQASKYKAYKKCPPSQVFILNTELNYKAMLFS